MKTERENILFQYSEITKIAATVPLWSGAARYMDETAGWQGRMSMWCTTPFVYKGAQREKREVHESGAKCIERKVEWARGVEITIVWAGAQALCKSDYA